MMFSLRLGHYDKPQTYWFQTSEADSMVCLSGIATGSHL